MSLSKAEQDAELAGQERDFYKRTVEAEEQSKAERHAEQQRAAEESQLRQVFKISDSEWQTAETLARRMYKDTEITPRHVSATHRLAVVEGVLKEHAPSALESREDPTYGLLYKAAMENPDFTREDLADIVLKTHGTESARRLARKVGGKGASSAPRRQEKAAVSFDDI
jgi:hypothetical protein